MEHYGVIDPLSLSHRQMEWYLNAPVRVGEEHPAQLDLTFDSYTSGISGPLIDHDGANFQEGSSRMSSNTIAAVEVCLPLNPVLTLLTVTHNSTPSSPRCPTTAATASHEHAVS